MKYEYQNTMIHTAVEIRFLERSTNISDKFVTLAHTKGESELLFPLSTAWNTSEAYVRRSSNGYTYCTNMGKGLSIYMLDSCVSCYLEFSLII